MGYVDELGAQYIIDQINNKIDFEEKGAPNGVASLDNNGKVSQEQLPSTYAGVYHITTNDNTPASDTNAYTALRANRLFYRKDSQDSTPYKFHSDSGIEIGNFVAGSSGASILRDPLTGQTTAEVDKLYVRMKAYFEELVIKNVSSIGGELIISPAGSFKCIKVEELDWGTSLTTVSLPYIISVKEGNTIVKRNLTREVLTYVDDEGKTVYTKFPPGGFYRCYFTSTLDGIKVNNLFLVNDLVICKNFNKLATAVNVEDITGEEQPYKTGIIEYRDVVSKQILGLETKYNNISSTYYWRWVVGVGDDYIDIAKLACDGAYCDAPLVGDVICHMGNCQDPDRLNFLKFSSVDAKSPSITLYEGVGMREDDPGYPYYSLDGKDIITYGVTTFEYDVLDSQGKPTYDENGNKKVTYKHKAFFNVYGDAYIGTRDRNSKDSSYMHFDRDNKLLTLKGRFLVKGSSSQDSELEDLLIKRFGSELERFGRQVNESSKEWMEIIQKLLDGKIDTWFGHYDPTLGNPSEEDADFFTTYPSDPRVFEWKDEDKSVHVGDLFYNKITGLAYRYMYDTPRDADGYVIDNDGNQILVDGLPTTDAQLGSPSYYWYLILDTALQAALAEALKAKDTADSKRRVFVNYPGDVEYEEGDLWVSATYKNVVEGIYYDNEILVATNAEGSRKDGDAFDIKDWILASKYTNDSTADDVSKALESLYDKLRKSNIQKEAFLSLLDLIRADFDTIIDDGIVTKEEYLNTISSDLVKFADLYTQIKQLVEALYSNKIINPDKVTLTDSIHDRLSYTITAENAEDAANLKFKLNTDTPSSFTITPPEGWTVNFLNNQLALSDSFGVVYYGELRVEGNSIIYTIDSNLEPDTYQIRISQNLFKYVEEGLLTRYNAADYRVKTLYILNNEGEIYKKSESSEQLNALESEGRQALNDLDEKWDTFTRDYTVYYNFLKSYSTEEDRTVTKIEAQNSNQSLNNTVKERIELLITLLSLISNTIDGILYDLSSSALKEIGNYSYLRKAFEQNTSIEGGVIGTSVISLGYNENPSQTNSFRHTLAGINGIVKSSNEGESIGSWWGGLMNDLKDYRDYTADNISSIDEAPWKYEAIFTSTLLMTWLKSFAANKNNESVLNVLNTNYDTYEEKWNALQAADSSFFGKSEAIATSLIRMDGSGYLANGAIWWGTDGKVHADSNSFVVSEDSLGDYLKLFLINYNSDKEIISYTPKYTLRPKENWNIQGTITLTPLTLEKPVLKIGDASIYWDNTNKAIKIVGGGLYTDSFISALGASTTVGNSGGSVHILSSWNDYNLSTAYTTALSAALGMQLKEAIDNKGTGTLNEITLQTINTGDYVQSVTVDSTKTKIIVTYGSASSLAASGVRSITEGDVNGAISVDTNGIVSSVKVHGLGSAAYKNDADFLGVGATAQSAYKLANAHNIWGQPFDGTSDITGNLIIPSTSVLKIGDATISWDETNQALKISTGLYSDSFISALGLSNISGDGGNSSYDLVTSWPSNSTGLNQKALGANLGYALYNTVNSLDADKLSKVTIVGTKGNNDTAVTNIEEYDNGIKVTYGTIESSNYSLTNNSNTIILKKNGILLDSITLPQVSVSENGYVPKAIVQNNKFISGNGLLGIKDNVIGWYLLPDNAFKDTTYTAGSNLTLSGTEFSLSSNNVIGALGYTPVNSNSYGGFCVDGNSLSVYRFTSLTDWITFNSSDYINASQSLNAFTFDLNLDNLNEVYLPLTGGTLTGILNTKSWIEAEMELSQTNSYKRFLAIKETNNNYKADRDYEWVFWKSNGASLSRGLSLYSYDGNNSVYNYVLAISAYTPGTNDTNKTETPRLTNSVHINGQLKIGEATLSWDDMNKALQIDTGLYSASFISALGLLNSGVNSLSLPGNFSASNVTATTLKATNKFTSTHIIDDLKVYINSSIVIGQSDDYPDGQTGIELMSDESTLFSNADLYIQDYTSKNSTLYLYDWLTIDAEESDLFKCNSGSYKNSWTKASDQRLKENIIEFTLSLEDIVNAPLIKYNLIGGFTTQVGSIALYWENILPEAVKENDEGYLGLDYDAINTATSLSLAKEILYLKNKINLLETLIKNYECNKL